MIMKPGGDGYFWKVVVVFTAILIMLCNLLYFLYRTGVIDRLIH